METAVIRAARAATVVSIDELVRRVDALRAGGGGVPPADAPVTGAKPAAAPPASPAASGMGDAFASVQSEWENLVAEIGKRAKLAVGFLQSVRPLSIDDAGVLLGYAPAAKDHAANLDMSRLIKSATKVLSDHLGRNIGVTFEPRDDIPALGPPPTSEASTPGISPPSPPPGPGDGGSMESREAWMHHPTVQKTLEMFSGDIVDIRD
jgi:hypothetical protein